MKCWIIWYMNGKVSCTWCTNIIWRIICLIMLRILFIIIWNENWLVFTNILNRIWLIVLNICFRNIWYIIIIIILKSCSKIWWKMSTVMCTISWSISCRKCWWIYWKEIWSICWMQGRTQGGALGARALPLDRKCLEESTGLKNYSQGSKFFLLASTSLSKFLGTPLVEWGVGLTSEEIFLCESWWLIGLCWVIVRVRLITGFIPIWIGSVEGSLEIYKKNKND
jgi:hypothetical protein